MKPGDTGRRMGHEFIGIVEAVGAEVRKIKVGDLVAVPFAWSDGTCEFCQDGLHTSRLHGGFWGGTQLDGEQGEAVRVPQADGTLFPLPVGRDHALLPSLLTLTDVMATGHHAAVASKVAPGKIATVVGGGAVGRVGVPQDEAMPVARPAFFRNVTISGGPATARACMDTLLPDDLEGKIEPGRVFDWIGHLEDVPTGYQAMNHREAIKVMIGF